MFSKKALLTWIDSRTVRPEDERAAATLRIAESATVNNTRAMYEMKIAAGARSERAAATLGVIPTKVRKNFGFPPAEGL